MKRFIFLLIILALTISPVYADKIQKVAENNVEVTPIIKVIDIDGNEVEIYNERAKKSYGQSRLTEWKVKADKKLADAIALDTKKYKTDLIAKAQEEVDEILLIQAEMDR